MMTKTLRHLPTVVLLLALGGCAAGNLAGLALETVGLRKAPELPDAAKPARTVAFDLQAADKLNLDGNGRPLALVARIYKLRQSAAFEQATLATFLNAQAEKEALGADLIEVKELTLIPGKRYQLQEKVGREAAFVGVVALFRAPDPQRWRLTFSAADAEKAGVSVGAYACALAAGAGASALSNPGARAPVRCR